MGAPLKELELEVGNGTKAPTNQASKSCSDYMQILNDVDV
jgi:hypothetical protein